MDVMKLSEDHDSSYACRGARVAKMTKREIEAYAKRFCMALQLKDSAANGVPIILALEALRATHNIPLDINPIEDEQWNLFGIADAVCDPDDMSVLCQIAFMNRLQTMIQKLFRSYFTRSDIFFSFTNLCFIIVPAQNPSAKKMPSGKQTHLLMLSWHVLCRRNRTCSSNSFNLKHACHVGA